MPFSKNFKDWLCEYEGHYIFENVKPYPDKLKATVIKKLLANEKPENEEEKQKLQEKIEKLISEFEFIKNYPLDWWMAEPRVAGGVAVVAMNDPSLNNKIKPNIEPKNRKEITAYTNMSQLQAVLDHADDVMMFPKDINKSLKKILVQRFVQNSGVTEEQATYLLNNYEKHRKYYTFSEWKEFLLKKSTNRVKGMGDDNFSLGDPEKGIPDIPKNLRYNLKKYNYYEQLEKLVDRLNEANLKLLVKNVGSQDDTDEIDEDQLLKKRWEIEKALLSDIEVVAEDDEYIIYYPKDAAEAVKIKDAEASSQELFPSWCICYKNTSNLYNKYRYLDNRTFYIVKNKKILNIAAPPMSTDREYEFFVVGVEPRRMVVTPQPNGDIEMTNADLLKRNPKMEKFLNVFKHVELSEIEKNIKNRFSSMITPEEFAGLSVEKKIYYKDSKEITDKMEIAKLNLSETLPSGISVKKINEKDLFLDICGMNNALPLSVFTIMSRNEQNKYVGFMKLLSADIINEIISLYDKGEIGLANRHTEIACRITDQTIPVHYINLFSRTFDILKPDCLGMLPSSVVSGIYKNIPDRKKWHEKMSIDGKLSQDLIQKFDDNAKMGWLKAEIAEVGLAKTLTDETYAKLFINLSANSLAQMFKEFGIKNISTFIKMEDIRKYGSSDWNTILKYTNFDDIIKYMDESVAKNLDKDTVCLSFISSNDKSAQNLINFYKDKYGDKIIMGIYPRPNEVPDRLANLYKINPSRFQSSIDADYLNIINKDTLERMIDQMQEARDSFTKFYFDNATKFAPNVTKMIVSSAKNPYEMAKKFLQKFGDDMPANVAYEIVLAVTDPKDSSEIFKQLEKYHKSFDSDMIVDLISVHGAKHTIENIGEEIYLKHEIDEENKPKSNKFSTFYNQMRDRLIRIPDDEIESSDGEIQNASKQLRDYIASLTKGGKQLEDVVLSDQEKAKLAKLKNAVEMEKIKNYIGYSRKVMQRQPKFIDWVPATYSLQKKLFILRRLLANPNIEINPKFTEELLRKGVPIDNFDEIYRKVKQHNPKNLEFMKKIQPQDVSTTLGNLILLRPSTRLIREFLEDLGPVNSKALVEQTLDSIQTPYSTWWVSMDKLQEHAAKYGKKWICSTDNFAIDRIKLVAQYVGINFDWTTLPVGEDCPKNKPAEPVE